MKLSIVIPCYNESKNIPLIFERLEQLNINKNEFEFILVNNGSTDDSEIVLNSLSEKCEYTKIVNVKINQGYGFGILSGLKECSGDFLGWTHADMQTDPKDILHAFSILKENNFSENLFIKGDRKGRPLFDQFFTTGMSFFETILMGSNLKDINAQPNIFHKSFFNSWNNPPKDFSLDLFVLYSANKQNKKVIRFPVLFPERTHGESKWNTSFSAKWKFIKRTIDFSFELKKRL